MYKAHCKSEDGTLFCYFIQPAFFAEAYSNPLTLRSDVHLISPYNITPESNIKVKRIKEMITN